MSELTVYAALAAVMADVDHVAKRDQNRVQGFNFRGIDAVVNAVGPVLRKHKVIVVPQVETYEYGTITTSKDKTMGHARVVVAYTFYGPDGTSIRSSAAGEAFDSGDKATPKAMSVAFRTALLQALALPTDEPDPDTQVYERGRPAADPMIGARGAVLAAAKAKNPALSEQDLTSWIKAVIAERKTPQTPDAYYELAEVINGMTDEPVQPEAVQS